jgi:gliding motility-associated lipoprotein GldJ
MSLINANILELNVREQKGADVFTTDAYLLGLYTGKVKKNLPNVMESVEKGATPVGRPARIEDGLILPRFRLPTEAEWEYGAVAQLVNPLSGQLDSRSPYSWKGNRVRATDSKMMAKFQKGRGDLTGVAGGTDATAPIPMAVNSFSPNDFGLYCMSGNVNEWVLDVYRPLSLGDIDEFRPFRGNVFTEFARNEDGKYYKDSLGRMVRKKVGVLKTPRNNYAKGDLRNYRDGDNLSTITANKEIRDTSVANSNKMYFNGGANQKGMVTLISEKSRVFKGGSYRDRAYWLSPGTRRFLDEDRAREDLGFRCAMDRLGNYEEFIGKNSAPTTATSKNK